MSTAEEIEARLRALKVFDVELPTFEVDAAPELPDQLFLEWFAAAIEADVREPHAMTISTIDSEGRPNSRVLILKALSEGRWAFATNRTGRKGREIESRPWAALAFYWPEMGRQVRVRGRVQLTGAEVSARDFLARPHGSRVEGWVGRPSEVLDDQRDLEDALARAHAKLQAEPDAVPPHWARYEVLADEVEFWQADRARRHVRLRYSLRENAWRRDRLWP